MLIPHFLSDPKKKRRKNPTFPCFLLYLLLPDLVDKIMFSLQERLGEAPGEEDPRAGGN